MKMAASYCGLPLPDFLQLCPIKPIKVGPGSRSRSYPRSKLDRWLEKTGRRTGDGESHLSQRQ